MKQNVLKKLLCLGMTGAMLMSCLSGCGSSESAKTDDAAKTETAVKTEETAEDTQDAASEEQVTIRFAFSVTEAEPLYEPLLACINQFMEENPNITVELELTGANQYNEKLATETASDTLPMYLETGAAHRWWKQ